MSRDYKHSRNSGTGMSGTAGLALGLAIGLGVALAVYLHDRRPDSEVRQPIPDRNATPRSDDEGATDNSAEPEGRKYDFYDMLPKFEVVVPEREKAEASDARPAVERPGAYVLQAGSYRNFKDADRARAQLALQGIESQIQRVTIDSDTWHRVRIGPTRDLSELNRLRARLREADIDALVIRVGE